MPARSPPPHSMIPAAPAPPRISRRSSPPVKRGRSLERHRGNSGPPRRRDFREGSLVRRRSRSPVRRGDPVGSSRDFAPLPKRNLSPPLKKSRRDDRRRPISPEMKRTRSKSPITTERGLRQFGGMQVAPSSSGRYPGSDRDGRLTRTVDVSDRFRGGSGYIEEERHTFRGMEERPIFRGPDGGTNICYDKTELKKITIEIVRKELMATPEPLGLTRTIGNQDIKMRHNETGYGDQHSRRRGESSPPPIRHRYNSPQPHHRSGEVRERSRARSPAGPRDPSHGYTYSERERARSPFDSRARSSRDVEHIEKRFGHDIFSQELSDGRRRGGSPHFRPEYRENDGSYNRPRESESDLRIRLAEKRNDSHFRIDDRQEREHHDDILRERDGRHSHRSPPPAARDRRREEFGPSRTSDRDARDREAWERERERERREVVDRKRRGGSRERDDERRKDSRRSPLERFQDFEFERKDRLYDNERATEKEFHKRDDYIHSGRGGRGRPPRRGMHSSRGMPPHLRGGSFAPPSARGAFRPLMNQRSFSPNKSPEPLFRRGKQQHY